MPNIIFILLMFLTLLVVLGCFYMTSSTNKKLNRLRRRYDLLLRGQTDINICLLYTSDAADDLLTV